MHLGIIKITYNRTATHFTDDSFVNLGEEVILTLLWQNGASESATVCFVISLSICYWLFKCGVLRVMCVLVCEREREGHSAESCVCVCVCERGRHGHITTAACGSFICVCHANLFPSRAWTDGKTKDIINCLYFNFESWSSRLWKGALHFRRGLWCLANHNALGQLANQSRLCLLEGGTL